MKKKTKAKMIIVCTLLLTLCLSGCGTLRSDTQQLKDLLADKYGEEFEIKSYYYDGDMWAMCYPVSDPTLVFQVRTDEHVERIKHDYYLQTVVERQVNEKYGPLVQQVFPGSFLSSDISASDYEGQTADKVTLTSMLEYNNSHHDDSDETWTYIVLNIFVDTARMTEENTEKEYEFLSDEIGSRVLNGELPDTIIKLYFGDSEFVKECESVLAETTWAQNEIYEKIDNCPYFKIFYYEEGKPELSGGQGELTIEKYIIKKVEVLYSE